MAGAQGERDEIGDADSTWRADQASHALATLATRREGVSGGPEIERR